jgi:hypothetical protein
MQALCKSGILKRLDVCIPSISHDEPNSIVDFYVIWRSSKSEIKTTSEVINRISCRCNPFVSIFSCNPWWIPSRTIFHNHWIETIKKSLFFKDWCSICLQNSDIYVPVHKALFHIRPAPSSSPVCECEPQLKFISNQFHREQIFIFYNCITYIYQIKT